MSKHFPYSAFTVGVVLSDKNKIRPSSFRSNPSNNSIFIDGYQVVVFYYT